MSQSKQVQPPSDPSVFVGIDVSKATLEVAVRPQGQGAIWQVPNDEAGQQLRLARLVDLAPTLVVLEATGRYELPVAATLAGAELPVAIANPRQVRDFAKATGRLGTLGQNRPARCGGVSPVCRVPRSSTPSRAHCLMHSPSSSAPAFWRRRQVVQSGADGDGGAPPLAGDAQPCGPSTYPGPSGLAQHPLA